MKKLLFIGHTYHQKTKSSLFLLELIGNDYEVTECYMDPTIDYDYRSLDKYRNESFDVLLVWQVMPRIAELKQYFSWKHAAFFPMYDHYVAHNGLYAEIWEDYQDFLIISFTKTMHLELKANGFDSRYIQYFPKPCSVANWGDEHALFFWQRLSFLNIGTLSKAARLLDIRKIHLHNAPDPGHSIVPYKVYQNPARETDESAFLQRITFSESTWFENKQELTNVMEGSALYMAPRHLEGIGMSFLEAMAHGRCVIAPDNATMNEYITHGVNGLLYEWEKYSELHCGKAIDVPQLSLQEMQQNAYQTIKDGYARWSDEQKYILDWLQLDAQPDQALLDKCAVTHGWKDYSIENQPWPDVEKLQSLQLVKVPADCTTQRKHVDVSVVTVVFNAVKDGRKDMLLQCLESVQMQEGVSVEHIIVDGCSTDGTLSLVKNHLNKHHPQRILSMKDSGIYDAMNRGIVMAEGDYIVFLNSDDFYHNPSGLSRSVAELRHTQCDFSFAPVHIIDESLAFHPHIYPSEFIREIFIRSVFSHQSMLVRRNLMLQMHGFDLNYRSAADYDFVLRMILSGYHGCYVNQDFVSYRMIGISSTNQDFSRFETALIYKRLYNHFMGSHLTMQDTCYIQRNAKFPKHVRSLEKHLLKRCKNSFVGLPDKSKQKTFFLPEIRYGLKCLLKGDFEKLYHFLLIHFNSRFSRKWYALTYQQAIEKTHLAPAAHYLEKGWREYFDPSPRFSTRRYLMQNPDVAQLDICPLVHWKLKGKREHRSL